MKTVLLQYLFMGPRGVKELGMEHTNQISLELVWSQQTSNRALQQFIIGKFLAMTYAG
jgi:hypothetical protein